MGLGSKPISESETETSAIQDGCALSSLGSSKASALATPASEVEFFEGVQSMPISESDVEQSAVPNGSSVPEPEASGSAAVSEVEFFGSLAPKSISESEAEPGVATKAGSK